MAPLARRDRSSVLAACVALGCGTEPSPPSQATTSTAGDTSTTGGATSTGLASDTTSTTALGTSSDGTADSTTGEPEPTEWIGALSPGLFYSSFLPCDEEQTYLAQGSTIPTDRYQYCSFGFVPGPFHLRFLAIERPAPRGFELPLLEVFEVLEGPCLEQSCDPRTPPSLCGAWNDFCSFGGYQCDVFAQDCPEGEKCMPWTTNMGVGSTEWDDTRCSTIADMPGQPGDPCTVEDSPQSGLDDCDLGVMCWHVDPATSTGTCVAMCQGDETTPVCTEPGTGCAIAYDAPLVLCLPPCDPGVDLCLAGESCTTTQEGSFCLPEGAGG